MSPWPNDGTVDCRLHTAVWACWDTLERPIVGSCCDGAFAAEVSPLFGTLAETGAGSPDAVDAWDAHIVRTVGDTARFEAPVLDAEVLPAARDDVVTAEVLPVIEDDGFIAEVLLGVADQTAPAALDRTGEVMLTEDAFVLSAVPALVEVLPPTADEATPAARSLPWLQSDNTARFDPLQGPRLPHPRPLPQTRRPVQLDPDASEACCQPERIR